MLCIRVDPYICVCISLVLLLLCVCTKRSDSVCNSVPKVKDYLVPFYLAAPTFIQSKWNHPLCRSRSCTHPPLKSLALSAHACFGNIRNICIWQSMWQRNTQGAKLFSNVLFPATNSRMPSRLGVTNMIPSRRRLI